MVRKLDVLKKEDSTLGNRPVGENEKEKKDEGDREEKDEEKEKNNLQPSTLNLQPPADGRKCFRCGQKKILNGVCQNCGERYGN